MSKQLYHWEAANSKKPKKVTNAKKAGTVVLHADDKVDLSFARLQKDHIHPRRHSGASGHSDVPAVMFAGRDDDDDDIEKATAQNQHKGVKAAMMTSDTAEALVARNGFTALLPTQAQCYRGIFKGRDVILHSRTGSGKTLSYALPIIERHFIFDTKKDGGGAPAVAAAGPFLLIFVFSNELAAQTKSVLDGIYAGRALRVAVAGFEDVVSPPCDILIGIVAAVDESVRGTKARIGGGSKRPRADGTTPKGEDDDEDADEDAVDEVDTTLGPRFSAAGRRMKALLKYIRRANGSLSEGLMSDFRAHHYVLCGATIPNWVIKAGFLGVKKFYYQLVTIGTQKLPAQLECYAEKCHPTKRIDRAVELLTPAGAAAAAAAGPLAGKRVVIFGTNKQLDSLEARLVALAATLAPPADASPAGKKKKQPAKGEKAAVAAPPLLAVRSLSASGAKGTKTGASGVDAASAKAQHHDEELQRIASIADFNAGRANVLLCTDLASRGLDFTDVAVVLMLSLPHHHMATEVFVHRAGRTARVGKAGTCLVLFDAPQDDIAMDAIQKTAHVAFKRNLPASAPDAGASKKGGSSRPVVSSAPPTLRLVMTVRNPFSIQNQGQVLPPAEMLAKALGPEDMATLSAVDVRAAATAPSAGTTAAAPPQQQQVFFSVPAETAHLIKKKLWKYDVKEAPTVAA